MCTRWVVVRRMSNETAQNVPYDPSDPPIEYFARQRKIYPRLVDGIYRRRKWLAMIVGMIIYYGAPFIRYDRGPYMPDQAILIDMAGRRAYWFFIEIWPQEVYYLTAILVLAALMLFFVTSLLGRIWCGYLCFQTVWTDLFVWVERVFQGDRAARMKLDESPWSFDKLWRKAATHAGWLAISLMTGGVFVLYFNDAPTLVHQVLTAQGLSPTVLGFVLGLTGTTYLMAGFAREQVCTFMCPYARFQSAMFDEDTLVIGYDVKRGEPRGKHKKGESWDGKGHCVDCTQCVQVCPTGIDIRDGLQIQCIACGLCVDACNSVMEKVGLPPGLIRYDTDRNLQAEAPHTAVSHAVKLRLIRPRTIYYSVVLLLVVSVVFYGLFTRQSLDLNTIHARNPLFIHLSDGQVRNRYEIHVLNMSWYPQTYTVSVSGVEGAKVELRGTGEDPLTELNVEANKVGQFRAFVDVPEGAVRGQTPLVFTLTRQSDHASVTSQSFFMTEGER